MPFTHGALAANDMRDRVEMPFEPVVHVDAKPAKVQILDPFASKHKGHILVDVES